ncbi:hypothetical protein ACHAXA_007683 [Cyclostephanos tholiformis]|uniref:CS domain-containing protein n=1 Tax=Cyclostephanos tholiformis TaxID=382380 RepID=A0ABD3SDG7_9STRA
MPSEPDDDDMTPAQRERWLRDRGVLIEKTAVDRRGGAEGTILPSSTSGGGPFPSIVEAINRLSTKEGNDPVEVGVGGGGNVDVDGIKFVYIPHDDNRPVSTLTLPKRLVEALGPSGDVLPTYVRSYFADGKSIDVNLFEEHARRQHHTLLGGGGDGNIRLDEIKSSTLANATSGGSVETFPLVRPSSTNHHTGVYIYLDEVGLLKKLSNNKRASTLANRCGYHPPPNFYGDVFVGRACTVPYLHNVDITEEDVLDTSNEWMVRASHENVAWQRTINEVTGREGQRQPDHPGTEGVAVHVNGTDDGGEYSWLQNDDEIEITIPVKGRVEEDGGRTTAGKKSSIKVAFQTRRISVKRDGETILGLNLYSRLDVDGCTWTLDGDSLVITCEKASGGEIWPRLED